MALSDFDDEEHYWYYEASGTSLDCYGSLPPAGDDTGFLATSKMIEIWNSEGYGQKNKNDIWGLFQNEFKNEGWYVPAMMDWTGFTDFIYNEGIDFYEASVRASCNLQEMYWTSDVATIQTTSTGYYEVLIADLSSLNWEAVHSSDDVAYLRLAILI